MRKRYLTGPPVGEKGAAKAWASACARWADRLWLNQWSLTFASSPEPFKSKGDAFHVAAQATYTAAYRMATLEADEVVLAKLPESKIDAIACHEAVHLLLAEADVFVSSVTKRLTGHAKGLADDQWEEIKERTVTVIADILAHPEMWKKRGA